MWTDDRGWGGERAVLSPKISSCETFSQLVFEKKLLFIFFISRFDQLHDNNSTFKSGYIPGRESVFSPPSLASSVVELYLIIFSETKTLLPDTQADGWGFASQQVNRWVFALQQRQKQKKINKYMPEHNRRWHSARTNQKHTQCKCLFSKYESGFVLTRVVKI